MKSLLQEAAFWSLRKGLSLPKLSVLRRYSEFSKLRDILEKQKINVVFDVGANKGWYSYHLRKIGYTGRIVSCEPIPNDCAMIEDKRDGDEEWFVVNKAIGKNQELSTFNIYKSSSVQETVLSSFLDSSEFLVAEKIDVEIVRLDELAQEYISDIDSPRIFVKSDTQGYDVRVWQGASGIHQLIRGIQVELSVTPIYDDMPHYTEVLQMLEAAGFELLSLDVISRNKYGSVLEYDCLMFRPT